MRSAGRRAVAIPPEQQRNSDDWRASAWQPPIGTRATCRARVRSSGPVAGQNGANAYHAGMDEHVAPDTLHDKLRNLPAVDHLLQQPAIASLLDDHPRRELIGAIREVLESCRTALRANHAIDTTTQALALAVRERLYARAQPSLRRVINATGIVLHTGLGRAPLAAEAIEAINDVVGGYCNLELELETGQRGNRHAHLRELLREITGAPDALVVNNNAAATFLALNACAAERGVVISRGQLVEIGGSYRLPDIIAAARCRMIEVGTTNRTRIDDYRRAIADDTRVLLRVHTSNYRVAGFTAEAGLDELVALARKHGLLVIDDLGSGLITRELPWPTPTDEDEDADAYPPSPFEWDEPTVIESVQAGADLTLFSGDKLLGGPQAGIIVGRTELIAELRRNPLARAFRPDKLTLAALEATLRLYRDPDSVVQRIPALRMLGSDPAAVERDAESLAQAIADALPDAEVSTAEDDSLAGGGSLPTIPFPARVVKVRLTDVAADRMAAELRGQAVPVICRIQDGALVLDPRTMTPADLSHVPGALAEAQRESQGT
jgi:L-seryl-tRNA(Ser) seleniumtransferase